MEPHPDRRGQLWHGADEPRVVVVVVGSGLPDLGTPDVGRRSGAVEDRVLQDPVCGRRDVGADDLLRARVRLPEEIAVRVGHRHDRQRVDVTSTRRERPVRARHLERVRLVRAEDRG